VDIRPHASELKFLVSLADADRIRDWARSHLAADPHGKGPAGDSYTTTTLYTDTGARDVVRRSGSYGRCKYRVRRYDTSPVVFLERKLRTRRLLAKRRAPVGESDLKRLMVASAAVPPAWTGAWFADRLALRNLHPVCQVTYRRTARVIDTANGVARLTIDTDLAARAAHRWLFEAPDYTPVLTTQAIVELKFQGALPGVFKALLVEVPIEPVTISKYRMSMATLEPPRHPEEIAHA
jgi:hypothetical protein